jgi:hypothetical protein
MTTLAEFMEYWSYPSQPTDSGKILAKAYEAAAANAVALKGSCLGYIVAGKDSRGRCVPVFDEARIDEVANLLAKTKEAEAYQKSIADDIAAFMEITEGSPTSAQVVHEGERLTNHLDLARRQAARTVERGISGGGDGDDQAMAKLKAIEAEFTPQLDVVRGKLQAIAELVQPYNIVE